MASINNIQRGTETIVAGDGTTITVTLGDTVDADHAFVSYSLRQGDSAGRSQRHMFTNVLTDTTISFVRVESDYANDITLEWEVVEFDTSVTVYRGIQTLTSTSTDVALPATVDDTASFALCTWRTDKVNLDEKNSVAVSIVNGGDDIRFEVQSAPSANNAVVAYQVVEFAAADADVQQGSVFIDTDETSATATLSPSVTVSDTFIVHGGALSGVYTGAIPSRYTSSVALTNSTTVTAEKTTAGFDPSLDVHFFAVQMNDGTKVEQVSGIILDGNTAPTAQPSFTAMANPSLVFGAPHQNGFLDGEVYGTANWHTAIKVDAGLDGLTVSREGTSDDLKFALSVVDWNDGAASETVDPAETTVDPVTDAGGVAQVTFGIAPAETVVTPITGAGAVAQVTFQIDPAETVVTPITDAGEVDQIGSTVSPAETVVNPVTDAGSISQVTFQVDPAETTVTPITDAGAIAQVTFQVVPVETVVTPITDVGAIDQVGSTITPEGTIVSPITDAGDVAQVTFQVNPADTVLAPITDEGAVAQITFQVDPSATLITPITDSGNLILGTETGNPAYHGLDQITSIYIGGVSVTKVYDGVVLLWEASTEGELQFDGDAVQFDGDAVVIG